MTESSSERHGCCPACHEPLTKVVAQLDPYLAQRRQAGATWFGERRSSER